MCVRMCVYNPIVKCAHPHYRGGQIRGRLLYIATLNSVIILYSDLFSLVLHIQQVADNLEPSSHIHPTEGRGVCI